MLNASHLLYLPTVLFITYLYEHCDAFSITYTLARSSLVTYMHVYPHKNIIYVDISNHIGSSVVQGIANDVAKFEY